jgi:hypothetical protein
VLRGLLLFEYLSHKATLAEAAIVTGQVDDGASSAEILNTCRQVRRAHPVVERDLPRLTPGRPAPMAALAEQLTHVGEERCLTDTTGHQAYLLAGQNVRSHEVWKPITKRAPDLDPFTGAHLGQEAGKLAHDQVDNVHGGGLALSIVYGVIQCEGSAEQRIRALRKAEHQELARPDGAGQFWGVETDAIRGAGQWDIFGDPGGAMEE